MATSGTMRATKFDPQRTNNSPDQGPNEQPDAPEAHGAAPPAPPRPAAPPVPAPQPLPQPQYRSAAPAAPPPPRPEPPRPEPARFEPRRTEAPRYVPTDPPRYVVPAQPQPQPQHRPATPVDPPRYAPQPPRPQVEPPRYAPPPPPPVEQRPQELPALQVRRPLPRPMEAPAPQAVQQPPPVQAPRPPAPQPPTPPPQQRSAPQAVARYGPGLPAPPRAIASPTPSGTANVVAAPPPPPQAPVQPPAPGSNQAYGGPGLPPSVTAPAPQAAAPLLRSARPRPNGVLEIGRLRYEELPAVIDLVNADLLPGQPASGRHALDMALRGESQVDAGWWRELANVQAVVARRGGDVVGAASYAVAPTDRSGWLLWLHAEENRAIVEALVDFVMGELTGSSHLYAFWIATALSLGLEALPVGQRSITHEVLQARGLVGRDSWRYLVLPMDRVSIDGAPEEVALALPISAQGEMPAWRLVVGDREQPVAAAEIALAGDGCGVLWWIDVEPAERGRGIGRRLLRQSLRFLALRGARTVAAFVDHGDPRERDPAILRLLGSAGFQEVDRLWSYESPRRRSR